VKTVLHQGDGSGTRSILRKIAITALVGAVAFPLTNLLFQSQAEQLAMTAAVGAVVLAVQLLIEMEQRLASVEAKQAEHAEAVKEVVADGFQKVNHATQLFARVESVGLKTDAITELVQRAGAVGPNTSPLVAAFMQVEIDRVTQLFRELAEHEATYSGEDRDWLLALTHSVTASIDALSLPVVDAGGTGRRDGFWTSDLGLRYLYLQQQAAQRNVRVRRVFAIDGAEADHDLLRLCHTQLDLGIEVRLLYSSSVPSTMRRHLYDFIVFDDALTYEVATAAPVDEESPLILNTRLILDKRSVQDRKTRFGALWNSAVPVP
jgi:hypothetical protein